VLNKSTETTYIVS